MQNRNSNNENGAGCAKPTLVAKRRRELGLSQEDFAEKAGISRNYLSLIERGEATNLSTAILEHLAAALGATPSELLNPQEKEILISPALRDFGLQEGLRYEVIDKLARIPRRGKEPKSVKEWKALYEVVRRYLGE